MNSNEAIVKKFEALIGDGNLILETAEAEIVSYAVPDYVDGFSIGSHQEQEPTGRKIVNKTAELTRFGTSSLSILQNFTERGDRSIYFLEFKKAWDILNSKSPLYIHDFQGIIGVLESAKRDILDGSLTPFEIRVASEVYGDLLDQAVQNLKRNEDQAAAILAGAILDDGLKKIAKLKNVTSLTGNTIEPIASDLKKVGVIDDNQKRKILLWASIHNKAEHEFEEFRKIPRKDVEGMLKGIEEFLLKNLG